MYNILTLNKIAAIGTSRLGDNYKYGDDVQNPDAVLVRSAAMHDMEFADNCKSRRRHKQHSEG